MAESQKDSAFYSSIGARYETAYAHEEGLLTFISQLQSHLPPNSTVLDVGCGTGKPVACSLVAANHQITGIDISPVMVDLSRQAVPTGTFEVADMRTYRPPSSHNFDAVINVLSLFVLSREEIEAMADRWASWLRPGGVLAVCSIAAEDAEVEVKGARWDTDGLCARNIPVKFMGTFPKVTLFSRVGWRELLAKRGFEVLEEMTHLFEPPAESECDPESHFFVIAKKR